MPSTTECHPAVSVDLGSTYGAYFFGLIASASLFGVACMQIISYFRHHSRSDPALMKWTVAVIWLFESAHFGNTIYGVHYYLVVNYNNPSALMNIIWAPAVNLGLLACVVFIVHLSYARRIYILTDRKVKVLPLSICFLALLNLAFSWIVTGFLLSGDNRLGHLPLTLTKVALAVAAFLDIVIAASLTVILHKSRPRTPKNLQVYAFGTWGRTDTLINRLILYTINNGILTTVLALLVMFFIIFDNRDLIYLALADVVSKFYAISMVTMLNSRKRLSEQLRPDPSKQTLTDSFANFPRTETTTRLSFELRAQ
ncbi:hypothetical protein BDZ89DRAFT_1161755 [Hymenopellis radicata]|nr:hypothetical protein BDZ89DRAFT_1161755 [Hymenopellis radicata]